MSRLRDRGLGRDLDGGASLKGEQQPRVFKQGERDHEQFKNRRNPTAKPLEH